MSRRSLRLTQPDPFTWPNASTATHMLETGYGSRATMTYTHVLEKGAQGVRSPLGAGTVR